MRRMDLEKGRIIWIPLPTPPPHPHPQPAHSGSVVTAMPEEDGQKSWVVRGQQGLPQGPLTWKEKGWRPGIVPVTLEGK